MTTQPQQNSSHTPESIDLAFVDQAVRNIGSAPDKLLPLLQAIQNHFGYLPQPALERLCQLTEITPADVTGVSTFYSQFRHQPAGQHTIKVCIGTACHVKGGPQIYDAFKRHLNIPPEQDTDPQKLFTVEKVACLGCCTLAPAIQIDDVTYGHLTTEKVPTVLSDFLQQQKSPLRQPRPSVTLPDESSLAQVRICLDSSCRAGGSAKIFHALQQALDELNAPAVIKSVACPGISYAAPIIDICLPDGTSYRYGAVEPDDVMPILRRHFRPRPPLTRLKLALTEAIDRLANPGVSVDPSEKALQPADKSPDDFETCQIHIATEHAARIDPLDLDEYIQTGGFSALQKCLHTLCPDRLIDLIRRSGLRGRGGAGYPTHLKWTAVRNAHSDTKFIICNADEGDPGAFMDRMLAESYPYRLIEGMAIAAYAVGASQGYLYVRAEYPLAIKRLSKALEICKEHTYLGPNILHTDFSLELEIIVGAGAFVCGEETALIASIEGRRGMPRLRPPYPAEKGLWGRPTLINNVETFITIPWIVRNGPEAFAKLGTETSKGTKVFALAGKIRRGGLIEVPMGISIRDIVDRIGGGVGAGRNFKAVQIGGPSGGCIPASLAHLPIDYETLTEFGAMMGSGGMVVLDDSDCMVEIARYFLQFTQDQSCGKCTPCRIGTRRMLDILEKLCQGQATEADLTKLEQLAHHVRTASLCGLGKTAPNPVLSTMRYFYDEYLAHVHGRCPAGKCKALITYCITDDCIGCTLCAQNCPADAIEFTPYSKHQIDPQKCLRCGTCKAICPSNAVKVQ